LRIFFKRNKNEWLSSDVYPLFFSLFSLENTRGIVDKQGRPVVLAWQKVQK
jgi:hypothetical protein